MIKDSDLECFKIDIWNRMYHQQNRTEEWSVKKKKKKDNAKSLLRQVCKRGEYDQLCQALPVGQAKEEKENQKLMTGFKNIEIIFNVNKGSYLWNG